MRKPFNLLYVRVNYQKQYNNFEFSLSFASSCQLYKIISMELRYSSILNAEAELYFILTFKKNIIYCSFGQEQHLCQLGYNYFHLFVLITLYIFNDKTLSFLYQFFATFHVLVKGLFYVLIFFLTQRMFIFSLAITVQLRPRRTLKASFRPLNSI